MHGAVKTVTRSGTTSPVQAGPKLQASSAKRVKLQAASLKPQAAGLKLQATSLKLHDTRTFIKFQATSVRRLNADETILRMLIMIGNLMCRQSHLVTHTNLELNCKIELISIVAQRVWCS